MPRTQVSKEEFERVLGIELSPAQWGLVLGMFATGKSRWADVPVGKRKMRGERIDLVIFDEIQKWDFNEYTTRDEDGNWWLIGLPGGPKPLLGPTIRWWMGDEPEYGWQHLCRAHKWRVIGLRSWHEQCAYYCGVIRPPEPEQGRSRTAIPAVHRAIQLIAEGELSARRVERPQAREGADD